MQSRCKKHCRWNERLRFNHITTLRRRMQVSKSFCGNAKRIKINSVLKVCLESRAFSLFQTSLRGYLKKSKLSSISTNAAGLCVKKPWNPQRIPAAFCLKFASCLRNIRHFLCFQIHLITLIPNMGIPLPRTEGTVRGNGTATFGLQMLPPFVLTASNRSQNQCGTKSGCSP